MNVKELNLQDLESLFNLTCRIRDGIVMMARANNNANTPEFRNINNKYNLLHKEIMERLGTLYEGEKKKEVLNEEVVH